MEVEVWPQTVRGEEKRITCQYLFPLAARIETDTLHSHSLFPAKANSRALPLFGIKRTSGSRLGESRRGQDSERGRRGKV